MRAVIIIAALLAALVPHAVRAQPVFDDPAGLVEYAYAPYATGAFPEDITELFSPTLKQLWNEMMARSQEFEMPIIDFDPFINAQDYELSELVISDPAIEADRATVGVSFLNFGEPQDLRFTLVRRVEGWKIDDIETIGGEFAWRLSELLAADPLLN
jgi:hypothetical protein